MFEFLIDAANDFKEAAIVVGGCVGIVMIIKALKDQRAIVPVLSMVLIVGVVLFAISDAGQQFTTDLISEAVTE